MARTGRPRVPFKDRFFDKVEKTKTCWLWIGSRNGNGYGLIKNGVGRHLRAHRVSWEIHKGPIPDGMMLCHKCDNPPCVNPDHLFLGDQSANMLDCKNKGRNFVSHGALNNKNKLTDEQVRSIRYKYRILKIPQKTLAKELGVLPKTISSIVRRRSWKHI